MKAFNPPNQDTLFTDQELDYKSRFDQSAKSLNAHAPLSSKARPMSIHDLLGQEHLLGKNQPLRAAIESGDIHSMIFWGPPGVGKTTLARIVAEGANASLIELSAVMSGISDIRETIQVATQNIKAGQKTLVFVDEAHRFNKSQQDCFLPYVEDGTIIFVGATTENPSFEINNSLLSRCIVYKLELLDTKTLVKLFRNALTMTSENQLIPSFAQLERIAIFSNGDARRGLNLLELLLDTAKSDNPKSEVISDAIFDQVVKVSSANFDKKGDYFFDFISALHKSIRGSSPDAALYWFCRLLEGGCDPNYIGRRIVRIASEDIGNADPRALTISLDSWAAYERLGSPEGELAIAQAIVFLASIPKSNSIYNAFNRAKDLIDSGERYDVPLHLRNAPTDLMEKLDHGKSYRYSHDEEGSYSPGECYFPEALKDIRFYEPTENGQEIKIKERLSSLKKQDLSCQKKRYP